MILSGERKPALARFGSPRRADRFVFGGSRGARRINEATLDAIRSCGAASAQFILQTGKEDFAWAKEKAERRACRDGRAVPHAHPRGLRRRRPRRLPRGRDDAGRDRRLRRAAILVPYPFAAYNHQESNAQNLAERGGAVHDPDGELTGERLAHELSRLVKDRETLIKMSVNARRFARPTPPSGSRGASSSGRADAAASARPRRKAPIRPRERGLTVRTRAQDPLHRHRGSGMSGLAEVLLTTGYQVSGSDLKTTEVTDRLVALGGRVFAGHRRANVEGVADRRLLERRPGRQPELRAAIARGLPVIPRADMLAELMRMKYGIAVGGAHGKTTTTSMVGAVLLEGGLDPTIVVGGRVHALGTNARSAAGSSSSPRPTSPTDRSCASRRRSA
jgi:hypothetical protein